MNSYTDIARRIASMLVSPETMIGLTQGMVSVPADLSYLAYGFIDTETRNIRQDEKIRLAFAVKRGLFHQQKLIKAVQIIIDEFSEYMPASTQERIYGETLGSIAGRFIAHFIYAKQHHRYLVH